jgi:hypothetical protein
MSKTYISSFYLALIQYFLFLLINTIFLLGVLCILIEYLQA